MLHQLQQAVEPRITLEDTMKQWDKICSLLSENIRKRRPQMKNYPDLT